MKVVSKKSIATAYLLFCTAAFAQEDPSTEESRATDKARQTEQMTEREAQIEVEVRMREAEQRLADAARQVADLSMSRLPRVARMEQIIRAGRGPVLGVTISADDNESPVPGVEIQGVSPGGAADDAGLRAGDVITSVNGEQLTAANNEKANLKLLDFMQGVEEGDTLDIEYLRNGKTAATEVHPRPIDGNVFAFGFDGGNFSMPGVPIAPNAPNVDSFVWTMHGDGFGDMELVQLTERLGQYFGTDAGLLVVRAPENDDLKLEDGDVILNIDGRAPTSVSHAMRILGSYESGEELTLEIMRDKRKREIALIIPDRRQGSRGKSLAPPVKMSPVKKVVVIEQERT